MPEVRQKKRQNAETYKIVHVCKAEDNQKQEHRWQVENVDDAKQQLEEFTVHSCRSERNKCEDVKENRRWRNDVRVDLCSNSNDHNCSQASIDA